MTHRKKKHLLMILALPVIFSSCELLYNPVKSHDIADSRGNTWEGPPITTTKTEVNPCILNDLSKTMPLSLLLDMALFNNPSTRMSWNAARASAYYYRTALSPYYPSISYLGSLNAQTIWGSVSATDGSGIVSTANVALPRTNSTYGSNDVYLSYLLFDFGGRCANAILALETLYEANWTHNFTIQQVLLSVLDAYTAYIGNIGLVEAYELDLENAKIALDATQVMHRAGLTTLTDVLSAKSNMELTKTNLIQAKGAEKTSLGELLISIGLPPDTAILVEQLPLKLPIITISGSVSSLLELAKKNRPDLGIAISQIKQQEASLNLAYSNSMPIITANANWNQTRFLSPRKPSAYNESAFLELSFPIFQGFYFLNQQKQLKAQIAEAFANLDVQLAAIATQVVTNYYSFTSASAAVPSSEAAVEYSQRAFKGFVVQYKTGTASILDLLNAQTNLSNARAQLVLTRTQWAASLANLAFAVGVLKSNGGEWREVVPSDLSKSLLRESYEDLK